MTDQKRTSGIYGPWWPQADPWNTPWNSKHSCKERKSLNFYVFSHLIYSNLQPIANTHKNLFWGIVAILSSISTSSWNAKKPVCSRKVTAAIIHFFQDLKKPQIIFFFFSNSHSPHFYSISQCIKDWTRRLRMRTMFGKSSLFTINFQLAEHKMRCPQFPPFLSFPSILEFYPDMIKGKMAS